MILANFLGSRPYELVFYQASQEMSVINYLITFRRDTCISFLSCTLLYNFFRNLQLAAFH